MLALGAPQSLFKRAILKSWAKRFSFPMYYGTLGGDVIDGIPAWKWLTSSGNTWRKLLFTVLRRPSTVAWRKTSNLENIMTIVKRRNYCRKRY